MTLRAKPAVRRPGRAGWDGDRRTTFINIAFVVAIVVSLVILVAYAGYSWWDDHNGMAAKVNGVVLTKDQLRARFAIETFRIDYTEQRIRTLQTAGHISDSVAQQELSFLEQRRTSLPDIALERIIDTELLSQLVGQEKVTVTDADVDAQLTKEATTDEERHVWVIEVAPATDPNTGKPTDAQKAEAKAKADAALAQLKGGKSWDEVAKATSTATSASQAGDLGWMPEQSGYDADFMTAVFAADQGVTTDVIEGADGTYRIGRSTEMSPASVDQAFQTKVEDDGIKMADYRVAARGDAIRTKLGDKILADLSAPGPQRHVLEILLPTSTPGVGAVKVRHILFSPKDDPAGAQTLPATDPAWAQAQKDAEAAYATLKADPSKFDEMARTMSDEGSAKKTGGKQPFYDATSNIDLAFKNAILDPKLKAGDLIPPFKSAFGWHVVQLMRPYGDGDAAFMKTLKDKIAAGADFAQVARDESEGPEAGSGGDIGWIAKEQLATDKDDAIWKTPVGGLSDVVEVANEGTYLFKVVAEETRTPTKEQIAVFKDSGFTNWYTEKKSAAKIEKSATAVAALGR